MRVLVYLFLFCLIACGENYQMATIHNGNLEKSHTFTLTSKCGEQVVAIKIEGYGNSEGSSAIHLILNNEEYKSKVLNGKFRFTWSGDWYSDEAIVRYVANSASAVNLKLDYRMECI
jgi:hypothetical protein